MVRAPFFFELMETYYSFYTLSHGASLLHSRHRRHLLHHNTHLEYPRGKTALDHPVCTPHQMQGDIRPSNLTRMRVDTADRQKKEHKNKQQEPPCTEQSGPVVIGLNISESCLPAGTAIG